MKELTEIVNPSDTFEDVLEVLPFVDFEVKLKDLTLLAKIARNDCKFPNYSDNYSVHVLIAAGIFCKHAREAEFENNFQTEYAKAAVNVLEEVRAQSFVLHKCSNQWFREMYDACRHRLVSFEFLSEPVMRRVLEDSVRELYEVNALYDRYDLHLKSFADGLLVGNALWALMIGWFCDEMKEGR